MKADNIELIGVMGDGIAQTLIAGGFEVRVRDLDDELTKRTRQAKAPGFPKAGNHFEEGPTGGTPGKSPAHSHL